MLVERWWGKVRRSIVIPRKAATSAKVKGDNHQQPLPAVRECAAMRVSFSYASLDLEKLPPD